MTRAYTPFSHIVHLSGIKESAPTTGGQTCRGLTRHQAAGRGGPERQRRPRPDGAGQPTGPRSVRMTSGTSGSRRARAVTTGRLDLQVNALVVATWDAGGARRRVRIPPPPALPLTCCSRFTFLPHGSDLPARAANQLPEVGPDQPNRLGLPHDYRQRN
jgi:hypothetical protein